MNRPLDTLATCETASHTGPAAPTRYAIRQALEQEHQKFLIKRNNDARQARYNGGRRATGAEDDELDTDSAKQPHPSVAGTGAPTARSGAPTRDFFGRIVVEVPRPATADGVAREEGQSRQQMSKLEGEAEDRKVWVSFHEGYSNAVRKPITLDELLRSF